jgi:predicted nuclease with TOPRIM domain
MGEACDEFMRSPQFQEVMKQSLNNSIQFRKQLNDFLGRMQHEFQGTSRQDVDSLMQVMEHVERRVTDSFERLSERLDELNERLERVEKPKPARKKTSRNRRGAKR